MKTRVGKNYTPEELTAIVGPLADAYNVTSVSVFGSRATGDYTSTSDYDFLIDINNDFTFHDYCRFSDGLEEALGVPVDIVYRSTLDGDAFSRRVTKEAIRVWG